MLLRIERNPGETDLGYEWIEVLSLSVRVKSCSDHDKPAAWIVAHCNTDRGQGIHGICAWEDIETGIRAGGYRVVVNNLPPDRRYDFLGTDQP